MHTLSPFPLSEGVHAWDRDLYAILLTWDFNYNKDLKEKAYHKKKTKTKQLWESQVMGKQPFRYKLIQYCFKSEL